MKLEPAFILQYSRLMNLGFYDFWRQIKKVLVKLQNELTLNFITRGFLDSRISNMLVRLGSEYGGWHVKLDLLEYKGRKLLISAGLGQDVTFDLEMLKHGFQVVGLDPLESSVKYAKNALGKFGSNVELIEAGIWKENGRVSFFAPKNIKHDSWSIRNVQLTEKKLSQEFQVVSLDYLLNYNQRRANFAVCVLKMDIEGAELDLFPYISTFSPKFDQVSIEMDFVALIKFRNFSTRVREVIRARNALSLMDKASYKLIHHENYNFTWISK